MFDNGPWPRLAPRERKEHMLKFAESSDKIYYEIPHVEENALALITR